MNDLPNTKFYACTIEACRNCHAIWEPFDPTDLLDAEDRTSSFKEPCDNCAFRPGSPEQADTEKWRKLTVDLKAGAQFFCHKGVPINPQNEDGFDYPTNRDGTKNIRRMRICRGWLLMIGRHWDKTWPRERVE
jgi:hypothetical protein